MKYLKTNKNINRGFRKLEVWQEAILLFKFVKEKVDTLKNISFKIKAQIEDSSLSVPSNIAEGYTRRHIKEHVQYNTIALSSLAENYTQVYALFIANIIEDDWFQEYDSKHYSLENKLINFNKSIINKLKQKEDWKDDYIIRETVEAYI